MYFATSVNGNGRIVDRLFSGLADRVGGIDMKECPPIYRWRGATTISIRLVGEAATRREQFARIIRGREEAENKLYVDEDLVRNTTHRFRRD